MGQKLHRGHRSVFKRRNPLLRILSTVLVALAIVAAGFFGTKFLVDHPISSDDATAENSASTVSTSAVTTTTTTTQNTSANGNLAGSIKAFWLPHSTLTNDTTLVATLKAAADADFNSVVVDMKNADGLLYYHSATDRAKQVNNFAADALTVDGLKTLFTTIKEAGLHPIARVYAFKDNAAARVLTDARITPTGSGDWVWYDNKPSKGGKAWLNPYADAAHLYIIGIARELRDAGADAILLDGVQFPAQVSGASFGSSNTAMNRNEILTAFVNETEELLGDTCPVILACTGDSAKGENTHVYGGNPLTFGAAVTAPVLNTQTDIAAAVKQMATRIKVIDEDHQPLLTPILQAETGNTADLNTLLATCEENGANGYILYIPSGTYDFSAMQ